MISPRLVAALSLSQLVGWGAGYYAIGVFGPRIAADLDWSRAEIHAGFSIALVAMGIVSPAIGRRIDRDGGRAVMIAGFLLLSAGLAAAALVRAPWQWWAVWAVIGVALRMTLYDACFAALVRVDPAGAARAITTVTLSGGLASTVFWALGDRLADAFGWRTGLAVFAASTALAALLPLKLPRAGSTRLPPTMRRAAGTQPPRPAGRREVVLFATLVAAANVLASALAAHMIPLLVALGVALPTAVTVAALRGVGQSVARAIDFATPRRLPPLDLALLAAALLPLSLAAAPFAGASIAAAVVFSFVGGAGNGLMTIARGTVPLALFDPSVYGAITGRIAAPAFWLSAGAPFVVALALDRGGAGAALALLAVPAVTACLAAMSLRRGGGR